MSKQLVIRCTDEQHAKWSETAWKNRKRLSQHIRDTLDSVDAGAIVDSSDTQGFSNRKPSKSPFPAISVAAGLKEVQDHLNAGAKMAEKAPEIGPSVIHAGTGEVVAIPTIGVPVIADKEAFVDLRRFTTDDGSAGSIIPQTPLESIKIKKISGGYELEWEGIKKTMKGTSKKTVEADIARDWGQDALDYIREELKELEGVG